MLRLSRKAGVFSRHRRASALAVACLLVTALALAGCGSPIQAQGPRGGSLAAASAASGPWVDASQATAAPGTAVPPTAEAPWVTGPLPGTPAPDAAPTSDTAAAPDGDSYQPVNFTGPIESLPANGWNGRWQVAGRAVSVSPTTSITEQAGRIGQGAQVNVQGWQHPDGTVDAGWITVVSGAAAPNAGNGAAVPSSGNGVAQATATAAPAAGITGTTDADGDKEKKEDEDKESKDDQDKESRESAAAGQGNDRSTPRPIEFRGRVDQLPAGGLAGDWMISGRVVHVNAHTRLQQKAGAFGPGAYVQLMGWQQPDGSINAAWIQTKKAPDAGGGDGNGNGNGKDNGKGNGNGKDNGKGNGKGNDKGKGGG